jgi:hypothetical protein
MTKAERLAAIFVTAFAIIYAPTMDHNWTLATYQSRGFGSGAWHRPSAAAHLRCIGTGLSSHRLSARWW